MDFSQFFPSQRLKSHRSGSAKGHFHSPSDKKFVQVQYDGEKHSFMRSLPLPLLPFFLDEVLGK